MSEILVSCLCANIVIWGCFSLVNRMHLNPILTRCNTTFFILVSNSIIPQAPLLCSELYKLTIPCVDFAQFNLMAQWIWVWYRQSSTDSKISIRFFEMKSVLLLLVSWCCNWKPLFPRLIRSLNLHTTEPACCHEHRMPNILSPTNMVNKWDKKSNLLYITLRHQLAVASSAFE